MSETHTPYITQITAVNVRPAGDPMFSERATTILLDDEGGGQFVMVKQDGGVIRIDPSEWVAIRSEINNAVARCNSFNEVMALL